MSAAGAAPDPQPSRSGRLLVLVRQLIDYARRLVISLHDTQHPPVAPDIARILALFTRGLLRAQALEARIVATADRLDAGRTPRGTASDRPPRPARPAVARPADTLDCLASLPTPEQIAAEVRRRPIGAVLADICRDLDIGPRHPLWRELSALIIRHGGNLATLLSDMFDRVLGPVPVLAARRAAPSLPSPAPEGTGPP